MRTSIWSFYGTERSYPNKYTIRNWTIMVILFIQSAQ